MRISIFLIFFLSFAISNEVLLLHSYHKGYKWSDDISLAVEQNLKKHNINLTTEYMHTKRIANENYFALLAEVFREKFKYYNFDLVIASDNNALDFIIKYKNTLFKDKPILFCGINNFNESLLIENNLTDRVKGVVENVDIEKNIELILKIHPFTKEILIINDKTKTSLQVKKEFLNIKEKFKNRVSFKYIDEIDFNSLKRKVKTLPENRAILFLLLFKDKKGQNFTYKENLKSISKASNAPIYGLWDFYLGEGIVGGLLTSAFAQGDFVSKMAIDILINNKTIENTPIIKKSPNRYMFDYSELIKFKPITTISVPKGSIVINKPFSFYESNKNFIWGIVFLFSLFIIIIVLLFANILKRKEVEKELQNQLKFLETLLDTIPHPIVHKDIDGTYLICNKAFAKLINKNREDIIGKTIGDFFDDNYAKANIKKDLITLNSLKNQEYEISRKIDNKTNHYLINKSAFYNIDDSLGGTVSVLNDITDKKNLIKEREFLLQQSKLAEMGEMIGAIAHQWNEPLVEISAIIQDLEFSFKNNELDEQSLNELVKDAMIQITYMSDTLRDFRNFLKPSNKKVLFNAKKIITEIFNIVGRQIKYEYIDSNVYYESENINIYGYENEFKQVLLTILNNAKDAIKDNKSKIKRGKIDIKVSTTFQKTKIVICDNAGGIDSKIIDRVFDAYFSTKAKGNGVGLYMSRMLIEDKMSGSIKAYNKNDGACFSIEVPNIKTEVL